MLLAREDINVNNENAYGDTALSIAASVGKEQIFRFLIRRPDADMNHRNKKQSTPLIWATLRGHLVIIELLLACKDIEIDAQENTGKTAMRKFCGF